MADLQSLLTIPGLATATTFIIRMFILKKKLSSLATNLISIALSVILSYIASASLGKFTSPESYFYPLGTGILAGLSATGLYENIKHISN